MGNQQAKEEPLVFYGSNVSLNMSGDVLRHLQGEVQRAKLSRETENINQTTQEPKVDAAQLDRLVNERVEQALRQLFAEHPELEKTSEDPHRALLSYARQEADFQSTEAVSQDLRAALERYRPAQGHGLPKNVKESHQRVLACYRDQSDRPLNCSQQVEDFKQAVREAQAEQWRQTL
ncbi:hypothetical protein IWQ62_001505 [Dispira parvispora]|uniref:Uncharacterized protein n=1 Tax=Dispira parvispora TaxID=1520584 RepID=A0A9W8E8Z9_9FUNG|nr:hypothetical protein IWQ62_001505 [Dispira parvispora]